MKWQAIAHFSNTLDKGIKDCIERKRILDASSEVPNIWADFVMNSSSLLDDAQNSLEVAPDAQGNLNCITNFHETHPDFKENNKPFAGYVMTKFDELAKSTTANVKNPLSRQQLLSRIGGYKSNLAEHLTRVEAKLIHDKRYSSVISGIEKTSRATYVNPQLFEYNLSAVEDSIATLPLLPNEKDKLLGIARNEISRSAGLSELHDNPVTILNNRLWKQYLDVDTTARFERQASSVLEHRANVAKANTLRLLKTHIKSIKETGHGIIGFEGIARATLGENIANTVIEQENVAKAEFNFKQDLKYLPLDQGLTILQTSKPVFDDPQYLLKKSIHQALEKSLHEQITLSKKDPAKLVENEFESELGGITNFNARLQMRKSLQASKGIANTRFLTVDEKNIMLDRINSDDVNIIKDEVDKILSLGENNYNLGLEILDELTITDEKQKLNVPVLAYAKARLINDSDVSGVFASIIPRRKEFFSMQTDKDKNNLKLAISDNSLFKSFKKKKNLADPLNVKEISDTAESIRYLSRFYQLGECLNDEDAVRLATEKLIDNRYHVDNDGYLSRLFNNNCFENLIIPKQIIKDGRVVEIDDNDIKDKLLNIRKGLIDGSVDFDATTTFGDIPQDLQKNVLASGRFALSSDGKSIKYYFTYKNVKIYLMLDSNNPLTIGLSDD